MTEPKITAEGQKALNTILSRRPKILHADWRAQIMRMVSLLLLERGQTEADKDVVIEAARFVTSPGYIPYFDMLESTEEYKKKKRNWNYDKDAYYAGMRAVKRWPSTATKPKKPPAEMKVLAINSSPRLTGNTQMLIDAAISGMRDAGVTAIEKLFLQKMKIGYCVGDRKCKDPGYKNICSVKDEMDEVYEKIKQSDVFIVGFPIYTGREPAQLCTFFDRLDCFRRFDENQDRIVPTRILEPGLRRAMVIGTWGYQNLEIYDHVVGHIANLLNGHRIEPMEAISACGFSGMLHGYDENKKAIILRYPEELKKVFEAGKTLVTGIM